MRPRELFDLRLAGRCSLVLLVAGVALGCGGSTASKSRAQPGAASAIAGGVRSDMGSPNIGDPAPDFELPDRDGNPTRLSSLRGSWVVIHFGTSWCPYCLAELPHLAKLADEYAPMRVKVLWIDVKETPHKYAVIEAEHRPTFPILWDTSGEVAKRYAPSNALPDFKDRAAVVLAANLLLDLEGKIIFYTLLDSARFDAKLVHLRERIDRALASSR